MPNIDERLEALAHTVELIASLQQANEEKIAKLVEAQSNTEKALQRMERGIHRFRHFVLALAADREARLLKLEGEDEDPPEQESKAA